MQELNKLMKAQGGGKVEPQALEEWLVLRDKLEIMIKEFEALCGAQAI